MRSDGDLVGFQNSPQAIDDHAIQIFFPTRVCLVRNSTPANFALPGAR